MKALSLRQPWAWLAANGHKTIENRTWATRYRGLLLLHAGLQPDRKFVELLATPLATIDVPDDLAYGGIVGVAELVDCVTECDSEWFVGPVGWLLRDARPVEFVPCLGRLGLFEVPWPGCAGGGAVGLR